MAVLTKAEGHVLCCVLCQMVVAPRPPCQISASACSRPQLSFTSGSRLGIHNDAAGHEIPTDEKAFGNSEVHCNWETVVHSVTEIFKNY